jgi:hypothetical protein
MAHRNERCLSEFLGWFPGKPLRRFPEPFRHQFPQRLFYDSSPVAFRVIQHNAAHEHGIETRVSVRFSQQAVVFGGNLNGDAHGGRVSTERQKDTICGSFCARKITRYAARIASRHFISIELLVSFEANLGLFAFFVATDSRVNIYKNRPKIIFVRNYKKLLGPRLLDSIGRSANCGAISSCDIKPFA